MTTIPHALPPALHYRDGAWVPGPDPVGEAVEAQSVQDDWLDCVARAGFDRNHLAEYGGFESTSYARLFAALDGQAFFMAVSAAGGPFEQHLYFHSVIDALDHAARWAPAFALQLDAEDTDTPSDGAPRADAPHQDTPEEEESEDLRRRG
ncbi:hypothetical protein ACFPZ0_10925 [Streptomonospora nanhaiensis]|uniref:hypothetical protein n=1 Tax=Streptomonospora nanhaiensis TaxID=1323731 RepID=UPI001FE7822F|nr:hypothetical protein [Streptomonospora nanhaiensis]